jgi:hypothetical protein
MIGHGLGKLFHASMSVAKSYLEVDDGFSGHAESEMPRFDDPGMYRADRDLEYALSVNVAEHIFARHPWHRLQLTEVLSQGIMAWRPIVIKEQGSKVGMSRGK